MKSKPPSKKTKLDTSAEGSARAPSPAGSTSSNASSLLSIPPPLAKGADMASVVKAVTSGVKAQAGGGSGSVGGRTSSAAPTYPTYVHNDLSEWPRISMLLKKTDGKPVILGTKISFSDVI